MDNLCNRCRKDLVACSSDDLQKSTFIDKIQLNIDKN